MMEGFEEYRIAYDAMEADPAILKARKALADYQASLIEIERPYRDRMCEAAVGITALTLSEQKSITLFGVEARYTKGRETVSWKSVAQDLNPPEELIGKYTKTGEPSVNIKVVGG